MILVDTSAWVEFLRASGSPVNRALTGLITDDVPLATTDVIVMEILAGARDGGHLEKLRRLLRRCELIPVMGLADYELAAELYRACRRGGEPVRNLLDCLIATVAIRAGAELLQLDSDFQVIARHASLRLVAPLAGA